MDGCWGFWLAVTAQFPSLTLTAHRERCGCTSGDNLPWKGSQACKQETRSLQSAGLVITGVKQAGYSAGSFS